MTEQERIEKERLELETLKRKSPYGLPDNPSASGWTSSQIKSKFYDGMLYLYSLICGDRKDNSSQIEKILNDIQELYKECASLDSSITQLVGLPPEELNTLEKIADVVSKLTSTKADKTYVDRITPTKLSQLTNDTGFVNKLVDNLENYYTKTNLYNKTEINNLIRKSATLNLIVVDELPTEDISKTSIYLKSSGASENNHYEEYIYVSDQWEMIGTTNVDLTPYALKEEVKTAIDESEEKQIITNETPTSTTIGGITKGTVLTGKTCKEIIEEMLFPYVAFSLNVSSITPSTSTYEKGSSVTITAVKVSITSGSKTVTNLKLYESDKTTLLGETNDVKSSNTFSINKTVTSSVSFYAVATDGTKTLNDSSSFLTFLDPTFYGVLDKGYTLSSDLITGKNKELKSSRSNTFSYTASEQHPFVAFPSSYGNLTSILDSSNLEYIGDFTKTTMNLNVLSGSVSYNIYVLKDPTDISDYKFIFK